MDKLIIIDKQEFYKEIQEKLETGELQLKDWEYQGRDIDG